MEKDGHILSIDKDFRIRIEPLKAKNDEILKNLFKSYEEGHISINILQDFLKSQRI